MDLWLGPLALVWVNMKNFFEIGFNSRVFNKFLIIKTGFVLQTSL